MSTAIPAQASRAPGVRHASIAGFCCKPLRHTSFTVRTLQITTTTTAFELCLGRKSDLDLPLDRTRDVLLRRTGIIFKPLLRIWGRSGKRLQPFVTVMQGNVRSEGQIVEWPEIAIAEALDSRSVGYLAPMTGTMSAVAPRDDSNVNGAL